MKILFITNTISPGKGGHFHTLNHVSIELSKRYDCKIITIGPGKSNVIANNPFFIQNIKLTENKYLNFLKQVKEVIRHEAPDIIHFFEVFSYNVIRPAINPKKQKICITKPGGQNPLLFPYVPNIVLFSFENMLWFKKRKKYNNANIFLIPNRVKKIKLNPNYKPINKLATDFNFVRICRIGYTYKKSIYDSIELIVKLRERGNHGIKLFIIGYIENDDFVKTLLNDISNMSDFISVITTHEITNEASRMLYLADAVIGTGRGLMEASSIGKPLLAINATDNIPILLDYNNFHELFETNFSERGKVELYDRNANLIKIEKLVNDKQYYKELSKFAMQIFEEYFNIDKILDLYTAFYNNSICDYNISFADFLYSIRHIRTFVRLSK